MSDAAFVAGRATLPARSAGSIRFIRQTGFYPLYDGENDQVDPVGPVRRARFQRIVPRYRLSASETNDTGLGPPFYELPVYSPPGRGHAAQQPASAAGPTAATRAAASRELQPSPQVHSPGDAAQPPLEPWRGTSVDFYA